MDFEHMAAVINGIARIVKPLAKLNDRQLQTLDTFMVCVTIIIILG